jgi:hypothetical protein
MKRSIATAIRMKQSSAYKALATTQIKINAIRSLKSFPGSGGFISEDALDAQAELVISGGYSKKRNPICSSCFTARANNGSCGCS